MSKARKLKRIRQSEFTGIKMNRELYERAQERAGSRHQTYSEYVRQLIVRDIEQKAAVR
jgi:predicted DNA-binding protein